jgi:hypothetical protein
MKKLLAKKASDILNASVKVGAADAETFKWFTGSIEIPSDTQKNEKK